ncbi:MAG: alkaline phosphatase family protein, partial [Candidatus Bathyarchaeota archaeon]
MFFSLRSLDVEYLDNKVFVLGIDGFDWNLLQSFIQQDQLPTFKKLLNDGVGGELTTTIPPITGSAWASLVTGKNPGKHGVFDFFYRQENTYDMTPINSSNRMGKSIWDILSKRRKKVVVVNIPGTYPPQKVSGIMITGKLTPSEKEVFTYPPSLSSELRRKGYIIHMTEVYSESNGDTFLRDVYHTLEKRTKIALDLIKSHDWDFFIANFDCVDEVQHWFWQYMDSRKNRLNSQKVRKYEKAILQIYKKMDKILEEFLMNLDEETTIMVVSDHGFGPQYGLIHLNNWLMDIGLVRLKKDLSSRIKFWLFKHGLSPQTLYNFVAM